MADRGHQRAQGRLLWGAGPFRFGVLLLLVRVRAYLFPRLVSQRGLNLPHQEMNVVIAMVLIELLGLPVPAVSMPRGPHGCRSLFPFFLQGSLVCIS